MSVKSFSLGVVATVALLGLAERAYHTFTWSGRVNIEAKAGAASYTYLTESIGTDSAGKPVTRAQVIDNFIKQAQRASQSQDSLSPGGDPR